jgi:predicted Fe-Mo cluster-binding NifX family protein
MKAAFTVWNRRISPLFDVARRIEIVETAGGRIVKQSQATLDSQNPAQNVKQLAEMGVTTLVCGAISRSVQSIVAAFDIELVAFIHGDLATVIDAWKRNLLHSDRFRMPGCRKRNTSGA